MSLEMRDILKNTVVYIDSNIFIYDATGHSNYGEKCKGFLRRLERKELKGIMSNDATHVATMKTHGISDIATNDPDFERVEGIKVWKP